MNKKILFCITVSTLLYGIYADELSLKSVIMESVTNNPEITMQAYALAAAQGTLISAKRETSLKTGFSLQIADKGTPIADNDIENSEIGIPGDSILTLQRSDEQSLQGIFYLEKLFVFGLKSRLSFEAERTASEYIINENTDKYESFRYLWDPNARNYGTVEFSISLPLLKSFANSITQTNIQFAESYLQEQKLILENKMSQVIIAASKAYWDYVFACKTYSYIEDLLQNFEQRKENLQLLIQSGFASEISLVQLETSIAKYKTEKILASQQITEKSISLSAVMGKEIAIDFTNPISIVQNIKDELPKQIVLSVTDRHFLKVAAENCNSILRIKKENKKQAIASWNAARISARPNLDVVFSVGHKGTCFSDNYDAVLNSFVENVSRLDYSGGIVFSCTIPNANSGTVESAYQTMQQAAFQVAVEQEKITADLVTALSSVDSLYQAVQNSYTVLEMHTKLVDGERKRFDAGLVTVDSLYAIEEQHIEARNNYCSNYIAYIHAVLNLKYLTGSLSGFCNDEHVYNENSLYSFSVKAITAESAK